ncbi:MAG: anhydro-N-acetylmuramic acid kinase [Burkholderiaceae bacterium]
MPASLTTVGLMSGTSLDGVDGIAVRWSAEGAPQVLAFQHLDFPEALRTELFALQLPCADELARSMQAANAIAEIYAAVVQQLLTQAQLTAADIHVTGAHGQTIRHAPGAKPHGYTVQLLNASLLAERTGIPVAYDFRSADIAAGGQGAPLVPAFHARMFALRDQTQVVCNIGGIANISVLHADGRVQGFDTGPGNVFLDLMAQRHLNDLFDKDGALAAQGRVHAPLLAALLSEPYFDLPAPKSTGRDLFNAQWLDARLNLFAARSSAPSPASAGEGWGEGRFDISIADIQATLVELTAHTLATAIKKSAPYAQALWVCGGGAFNHVLMRRLTELTGLHAQGTSARGVPELQVEALAFAWLARARLLGQAGNVPSVTGAGEERVLGSLTA